MRSFRLPQGLASAYGAAPESASSAISLAVSDADFAGCRKSELDAASLAWLSPRRLLLLPLLHYDSFAASFSEEARRDCALLFIERLISTTMRGHRCDFTRLMRHEVALCRPPPQLRRRGLKRR